MCIEKVASDITTSYVLIALNGDYLDQEAIGLMPRGLNIWHGNGVFIVSELGKTLVHLNWRIWDIHKSLRGEDSEVCFFTSH